VLEKGTIDNVATFVVNVDIRYRQIMGTSDSELIKNDTKTFVVINDYEKLRNLFGELLKEVQRIKSEGDYEAAKNLVETYGIKINPEIHKEIKTRYEKLNIAPYKGFVNPVYTPIFDEKGEIIDVKIDYTEGYTEQMLRYSREFSR